MLRQQLRAVQDRDAGSAGSRHVGHLVLDGGGDDEAGARPELRAGERAVLRDDDHAGVLELCAQVGVLPQVEGAIAAAGAGAAQHLEQGQRAHAAAADAGEVQP